MAESNPFAKVFARAWKDPEFKKKLLKDPKAACKEMGVDLPQGVSVKIVENTPKSITMILPTSPTNASELQESELERLAAGATNVGTGCPECTWAIHCTM